MSLYSQTNFQEGLVVTSSGDTLHGEIDFQDWNKNPRTIDFRERVNNEATSYTPEEIEFFSVADKRYVSRFVTIDQTPVTASAKTEINPSQIEERVFLQILVRGTVSLYKYKSSRENYYIESNGKITELISHQYVIKRRNRFFLVDSNQFNYKQQIKELRICKEDSEKKIQYKTRSLQEYIVNCNLEPTKFLSYTSKKEVIIKGHSIFIGTSISSFSHTQNTISLFRSFSNSSSSAEVFYIRNNEKLNYDMNVSFNLGYKIKLYLPGDLRRNSVSLSAGLSSYSFKYGKEFDDLSFTMNTTEIQRISNIKTSFKALDLNIWYSRRIKHSINSHFFEFGISTSSRFSQEATAFYSTKLYNNNDLESGELLINLPVQEEVQETRDIELDIPNLLIGLFGGIGYETEKFYSSARVGFIKRRENSINQNYISISVGYKF